ncbi:Alpha/Beta hydrolase protein [Calycina marina]|uniref:Alpha/Beta hydrolase protein n=1 Tax=Calycina marina TaxID=1763456 RepID=A0A9P7Z8X2_9HELO|nr:Alpha/Beta hydrolase protein [Calycina marina]
MKIYTPNKRLKVPSKDLIYTYIHLPAPPSSSKPTLLFIHGFPDTSAGWSLQISHFNSLGYGILAPDCLGYGGSSKPLSLKPYIGASMAADLIAILNHEKITSVVGIAHDWGTYVLSALVIWYPQRITSCAFLSIGFSPPGKKFDIARINAKTKRELGYEMYGYQVYFAEDGAGKDIGRHWESFFNLIYAANPDLWGTTLAPLDVLKSYITTDTLVTLAPYIPASLKAHHHSVFGDDYSAPCKWYKRAMVNLGLEEEREALKEKRIVAVLAKRTLMVTGSLDKVCLSSYVRERMNVMVKGGEEGGLLTVVDLEAGHWIVLDKEREFNNALEDWLRGDEYEKVASML